MTIEASQRIDGLSHVPLEAQFGWAVDAAANEPCWRCTLRTPVPVLPAVLLQHEQRCSFAKCTRAGAAPWTDLTLSFPYDPRSIDSPVHVSLYFRVPVGHVAGAQMSLHEPMLKIEPQRLTSIHLVENASLLTGAVIHLADVGNHPAVSVLVVLIAKSDTEFLGHGGRWRIKRRLHVNMPASFVFLNEGRWSAIPDGNVHPG
jgi:hypothetical protein